MIFSSPLFIFVFLPITFFAWQMLSRIQGGRFVSAGLVFASLAFYANWKISYLPLMLISVVFNFGMGKLISGKGPSFLKILPSRWYLIVGVVGNIAALGVFKYTDFIFTNINLVMNGEGPFLLHLMLPLGISFFTFQQIAYLADTYQGKGGVKSPYNRSIAK